MYNLIKKTTICFVAVTVMLTFVAFSPMTVKTEAATRCKTDISSAAKSPTKEFKITKKTGVEPEFKKGEAIIMYKTSATPGRRYSAKAKNAAAKNKINEIMDEIPGDSVELVIEKKRNPEQNAAGIWQFEAEGIHKVSSYSANGLNESKAMLNIAVVRTTNKGESTKAFIKRLKENKNIICAEPNYRIHAMDIDGKYYDRQWGLHDAASGGINTKTEWGAANDNNTGSKKTVVAIVDTGIDQNHPDLKDNLWNNPAAPSLAGKHGFDFVNGDDDPQDDNGHGTHCAGIIGAVGNEDSGVSGVNKKVSIMALKILDEEGYSWGSESIDAYHYIYRAMKKGIKVSAINNSWGGDEDSKIFDNLIDVLGNMGAVSVCAAGNEAVDNDKEPSYPACCKSRYKISVAATREDGELVSFSNHGKKTTDIAAPGTDILSTVSYDCYQPALYGNDQAGSDSISDKYFNFNDGNIPVDKDPNGKVDCTVVEDAEHSFGKNDNKALKLHFSDMDPGEISYVKLTYKAQKSGGVSGGEETREQRLSAMVKANAPGDGTIDEDNTGVFMMLDLPKDKVRDIKTESDLERKINVTGYYISGKQDYWDHYELVGNGRDSKDRDLVLMYIAGTSGEPADVYIDDLAVSNEKKPSEFGKYEFYSGTSMAAPFVTGAVALKSAASNEKKNPDKIINELLSSVRKDKSPDVRSKGCLDLSKTDENLGIRVTKYAVNPLRATITIKGDGFDNVSDFKISVNGEDAEIISGPENNSVTVKDKNWINNIAEIKASGVNSSGNNVEDSLIDEYMVKGKSKYARMRNIVESENELSCPLATNGRSLFVADSDEDQILKISPFAKTEYPNLLTRLEGRNLKRIFKTYPTKNQKSNHDLFFGNDLVYMNQNLYNLATYAEIPGEEYDDHGNAVGRRHKKGLEDLFKIFEEDHQMIPYAYERRLICINSGKGSVKAVPNPPASYFDLDKLTDPVIGAYNGKLFVLGGYDYDTKNFSKKTFIYNPLTRKWSKGAKLPEAVCGGRAIQTGGKMIYAPGCSEKTKVTDPQVANKIIPTILVFNGKSWKKASAPTLKAIVKPRTIKREETEYNMYDRGLGVAKNGVVNIGLPVENYGDTFVYDVVKDRYYKSRYNYRRSVGDPAAIEMDEIADLINSLAVGKTIVGINDDGQLVSARRAVNSGFVKIGARRSKYGRVYGANVNVLPGSDVRLTIKAKKGYYIKSYKLTGINTVKYRNKLGRRKLTISKLTANCNINVNYAKKSGQHGKAKKHVKKSRRR